MQHPNPNILLRIAQADAFGMACEYIKLPRDEKILEEALKLDHYVSHPQHKHVAGLYGDDCQQSIACAEVLLQGIYTPYKFAEAFVNCFHRDTRTGYSTGFYQFILKTKTPEEFLKNIKSDSEKNGAAMRAPIIGILKTPAEVLEVARMQASVTHNTSIGIFSSQAAALMSHYALYEQGSFDKIVSYCKDYLPAFKLFDVEFIGEVAPPHVALKTIHAVVHLLRTEKTLLGILRGAILQGGDVDSVAAIAWGIASSRMKEELPEFFEVTLEPGRKYGPEFLKTLGKNLME